MEKYLKVDVPYDFYINLKQLFFKLKKIDEHMI